MRLFVVLAVAVFLAPAFASAATQQEPRDALGVTIARIEGKGVFVEWTPAAGAALYEIFRGPTPDAAKLVAQTPSLVFYDPAPPADEDVWYVIVSKAPHSSVNELVYRMRGACISQAGTSTSVTVKHCMPAEGPVG